MNLIASSLFDILLKFIVIVVFSNVERRKIFVVAGCSRLENVAAPLQEEIESVTDN